MRHWIVVSIALLAACSPAGEHGPAQPPDSSTALHASAAELPPALPLQLHGAWLNVGERPLRGDTLRLHPDSSASGIIPWPPDRYARISRWAVTFGSTAPAGTRGDWRHGYTDGGDPECFTRRPNPACVSMPHLCLGAVAQRICTPFVISNDSLLIVGGLKYQRVLPPPPREPPVTRRTT